MSLDKNSWYMQKCRVNKSDENWPVLIMDRLELPLWSYSYRLRNLTEDWQCRSPMPVGQCNRIKLFCNLLWSPTHIPTLFATSRRNSQIISLRNVLRSHFHLAAFINLPLKNNFKSPDYTMEPYNCEDFSERQKWETSENFSVKLVEKISRTEGTQKFCCYCSRRFHLW